MAATVHVVARFRAKEGKEDAVKSALLGLVAPTRREIGCYQYDLLQNPSNLRDFCFVERWDHDRSLDQHLATDHMKRAIEQVTDLLEVPPEIQRYHLV